MDEKVLRVPARHLEVFSSPSLAEMRGAIEANRVVLAGHDFGVAGLSSRSLRTLGRREALETAARPDGSRAALNDVAIIASGHQPELFHPGVWIKNHFVSALAKRVGGVSLNVVMDSDRVKQRCLAVPVRSRGKIVELSVPVVRAESGVVLEAAALDGDLVETCLARIEGALGDRRMAEAFARFAECARVIMPECRTVSEFLWRSRSVFEQDWALGNLELPVSRLCGMDSFLRFVMWLARQRERFREVHNERLEEYRRAHRIRTGAHPAPNLGLAGDACEMPFWSVRGSLRRRLWAAENRGRLTLMDDEGELVALGGDGFADLRAAVNGGLRLRPRAITNSLFLRLFVADLFVHGIGGAKYDTITDGVIRDFVGTDPPASAVLSATALLPFELHDVSEADLTRTRQLLRDTFWNPERLFSEGDRTNEEVRRLLAERRRLVAGMHEEEKEARPRRYERIHEVNETLARRAAGARKEIEHRLRSVAKMLEENEVMSRRDYPFVLYPRETLDRLYSFDLD
ncbi:MAG: hypothetical protein V2A58_09855 [Planctomycetota bacterium]